MILYTVLRLKDVKVFVTADEISQYKKMGYVEIDRFKADSAEEAQEIFDNKFASKQVGSANNSNYNVGKRIASLLNVVGFILLAITLIGSVIYILDGLGEINLFLALIYCFSGVISCLFLILFAQISNAIFDNANSNYEILSVIKTRDKL